VAGTALEIFAHLRKSGYGQLASSAWSEVSEEGAFVQVDWKNAIQKKRFLMVMARNDDDGFAGLKEELQEVEDEFNSVYPVCTLPSFPSLLSPRNSCKLCSRAKCGRLHLLSG
jgi:hypothetical protein